MNTPRREFRRDPANGKIAGVCAGLSDYLGIELWLVRIILVTATLLMGPFFVVAYIACWFILDKKEAQPGSAESKPNVSPVKTKVWQKGTSPRVVMHELKGTFNGLDDRIQSMERYVTSQEFTINHELNKL